MLPQQTKTRAPNILLGFQQKLHLDYPQKALFYPTTKTQTSMTSMTSTVAAAEEDIIILLENAVDLVNQKEEKLNQINQKEKDKHFKNHFI